MNDKLIEIGAIVEIPDGLETRIVEWNDERYKLPAGTKIYAAATNAAGQPSDTAVNANGNERGSYSDCSPLVDKAAPAAPTERRVGKERRQVNSVSAAMHIAARSGLDRRQAPQPSTADASSGDSQESLRQGGIAGADAELPPEPREPVDGWPMIPYLREWQRYAYALRARIEALVRERDAARQEMVGARFKLGVCEAALESAEARIKFLESACDGFAEQTKKAQELASARLEGK